jgi:hypothetical protein
MKDLLSAASRSENESPTSPKLQGRHEQAKADGLVSTLDLLEAWWKHRRRLVISSSRFVDWGLLVQVHLTYSTVQALSAAAISPG